MNNFKYFADEIQSNFKYEKSKKKRQSAVRKTVSGTRPKILDNDNNDGKVLNDLADAGKMNQFIMSLELASK